VEDLAALEYAAQLGWTGPALKTCKGHSAALLEIAWCHLTGHPYTMQDLTNPNIGAVQAAGLAARCEALNGVELNVMQFVPASSIATAAEYPELLHAGAAACEGRSASGGWGGGAGAVLKAGIGNGERQKRQRRKKRQQRPGGDVAPPLQTTRHTTQADAGVGLSIRQGDGRRVCHLRQGFGAQEKTRPPDGVRQRQTAWPFGPVGCVGTQPLRRQQQRPADYFAARAGSM